VFGSKKGSNLMAIAVEVAFHGQGATLENYFKSIEIMGAAPKDAIQTQAVCSTG
jgi:hypothetical protein